MFWDFVLSAKTYSIFKHAIGLMLAALTKLHTRLPPCHFSVFPQKIRMLTVQ